MRAVSLRRGLTLLCALVLGIQFGHSIDADKAAELSRDIREHFRASGANWVSPKMLKGVSHRGKRCH